MARLEMLAKDNGSGHSGCPSVYLDGDGMAVVQGVLVDTNTHDSMSNVLPGEAGVRINPEVLVAAVAALQRRR